MPTASVVRTLKVVSGEGTVGASLMALRPIPAGTPFLKIQRPRYTDAPTPQTVQVTRDRHVLSLGVLAYLNHSCKPNVVIDTKTMTCWTVRDIAKGDELTYFYASTEWTMARPFLCLCGAENCIRIVAGARHLPVDVLSRYFINDHIRTLIDDELATAAERAVPRAAGRGSNHKK